MDRRTVAEADPADPIAIALDVARQLDELRVPYVVGGSLASSVHGEPRSTLDVDMVVDLRQAHVAGLSASMRREYYFDAEVAAEAVRLSSSFNAVHLASAIKVDFFVAGTDAFEAERLRHRLGIRIPDTADTVLWVDTAEHSLLRKLEWFRRGHEVSDRQWRDAASIVAVQGDRLDRARLDHWAGKLGVRDLLRRLMDGA